KVQQLISEATASSGSLAHPAAWAATPLNHDTSPAKAATPAPLNHDTSPAKPPTPAPLNHRHQPR
ncbi:unnamed protein product, partial [Gadus morhua 'NCC']